MNELKPLIALLVAIVWQGEALAFRNCERPVDETAYRASSSYSVSEIEFDPLTRVASGTETHYNYSNESSGRIRECHVTYELRGVYEESSALFLLSATRTNQSQSCDTDFVEYKFPVHRTYTVQVDAVKGGRTAVRHADNRDKIASADWQRSHMSFTTDEACELM